MILPIEIEKNMIDYDVNIVKEREYLYDESCKDEVHVYWNKKNWFGKITRETTVYTFERRLELRPDGKHWIRNFMCETFLKRLKGVYYKDDVLSKLKSEFTGNDEFSLGVQHAISTIEEGKT